MFDLHHWTIGNVVAVIWIGGMLLGLWILLWPGAGATKRVLWRVLSVAAALVFIGFASHADRGTFWFVATGVSVVTLVNLLTVDFCQQCGKLLRFRPRYCSNCGASIREQRTV